MDHASLPALEGAPPLGALSLEHLLRDALVQVGATGGGGVEHEPDREQYRHRAEQDARHHDEGQQHDGERVEERVRDQRAVVLPAVVGALLGHA